ncbi:MAG TPA: hypothetical protein VGI45_05210 [Terracidiphilus sp.]|jgi:hypothetical protein
MGIRHAILGTAILGVVSVAASAQPGAAPGAEIPPGDRSFYLDKPVENPESLSGLWEASDNSGGAVGIHLLLGTIVSGDADPPRWTPQSWQQLELGVFHRAGPEMVFGEENYFADDLRGGSVTLENDHLQLHFNATLKTDPSVDLDLTRESDGCWRGRLHRGNFDSVVALCRPSGGPAQSQSPLAGTWTSTDDQCIHIFQTKDGAFTGWSDSLEVPGHTSFGPNIPGPHLLYQQYGTLAKVHLTNDRDVSIELNAFSAGCCSHSSELTLSADGSTLQPVFPAGSKPSHLDIWTKVSDESCVDPVAIRKLHPVSCPPAKTNESERLLQR